MIRHQALISGSGSTFSPGRRARQGVGKHRHQEKGSAGVDLLDGPVMEKASNFMSDNGITLSSITVTEGHLILLDSEQLARGRRMIDGKNITA
jgi:hypothetical protein